MSKFTTVKPSKRTSSITLPAEAGAEKTVIKLSKKWGADYIRDSDGTELSPGESLREKEPS